MSPASSLQAAAAAANSPQLPVGVNGPTMRLDPHDGVTVRESVSHRFRGAFDHLGDLRGRGGAPEVHQSGFHLSSGVLLESETAEQGHEPAL